MAVDGATLGGAFLALECLMHTLYFRHYCSNILQQELWIPVLSRVMIEFGLSTRPFLISSLFFCLASVHLWTPFPRYSTPPAASLINFGSASFPFITATQAAPKSHDITH